MAAPTPRASRGGFALRMIHRVAAIGRRIPLSTGRRLGRILGTIAFHVLRGERKKAMANLAIAFPDWPASRRRETVRAMFHHLGMSLFEIAWLPNMTLANRGETTTEEGIDRVVELVRSGKAVVTFTGHCGNWEWLAWICGLHMPVTALQRERANAGLNQFITDLRATVGIRTVDRGSAGSARELMQGIRKPGLLAFLIDQNIRAESVKVPFFGKPALTPVGPAKLAIRGAVPVVICFIHRGKDGMQHVKFLEPIMTTRDDDPIELTARLTKAIEDQIRQVPEQWVWMHNRWRERPKWDVTPGAGDAGGA